MEDTRVTLASWSYGGMWIFYNKSVLSLRPSALNMTLPTFAAERMRRYRSISAAVSRAQQASRTPLLLSIDGTDRPTDT